MKISRFRLSARVGFTALAAGLALGVCTGAMAQWKWRDGNNRVQYSDLPPPANVPEASILQRPAGAARRTPPQFTAQPASAASGADTAASGPVNTTDSELEAKRKKTEQDQAAARKADEAKVAAARAESCNRARAYQKSLDDGQRLARINANGEREVYDDKIRAEETKRARDIIASDCR
jgi:hypothetical protein